MGGGFASEGYFSDIWEFDTSTCNWDQIEYRSLGNTGFSCFDAHLIAPRRVVALVRDELKLPKALELRRGS